MADLKDVRQILEAVLTYLEADEIMRSQLMGRPIKPWPMTQEVARLRDRVGSIIADHLLFLEDQKTEQVTDPVEETSPEEYPLTAESSFFNGPNLSMRKQASDDELDGSELSE